MDTGTLLTSSPLSPLEELKAVMRERDGHDDGLDLSVSAGVATAPPQESLNAAFAEADRLMYAVKPPER
jgi:GGDEF domain-containing protein